MKSKIKWHPVSKPPSRKRQDEFVIVTGTMDGPHDWRTRMGYFNTSNEVFCPLNASWKPVYWAYMPRVQDAEGFPG